MPRKRKAGKDWFGTSIKLPLGLWGEVGHAILSRKLDDKNTAFVEGMAQWLVGRPPEHIRKLASGDKLPLSLAEEVWDASPQHANLLRAVLRDYADVKAAKKS